MSRKKPQNLYPVKDLAEANTVLADIGALKRQIELMDAAANNPDRREFAEICLAAEVAVQRMRRYFGKAWGHSNEHGSAA